MCSDQNTGLFLRSFAVLILAGLSIVSPSFGRDCETISGNRISPCGFESLAEVAAWFTDGGTLAYAAGLGETGDGALGTAEDFGTLWAFQSKSPCFEAAPGQEFALGYWVKHLSGAVPDRCSAGWQQYSDLACSAPSGGASGLDEFFPGANYIEVTGSHLVQAGTQAMSLVINCRGTTGPFEVLVDNGYARPTIFTDGFETGDTTAWSAQAP